MDLFTCGICKLTFHKLDGFLEHKHKHDFQKQPSIRSGGLRSKTDSVDHAFPNIKTSVASSTNNSSTSPFLTTVPRIQCPSLLENSPGILSQISECPSTPRCTMPSVVVSSHCNSVASKLVDENTTKLFEIVTPRSQESAKSNLNNSCIETGSFASEDGDVIFIEISENKRQDGELRAKVCRPNFESSEASHKSSITRSEALFPRDSEEEESVSSGLVNSRVRLECGISEAKIEPIQTHFSSSLSTLDDPGYGKGKNVESDSYVSSAYPCAGRNEDSSSNEASNLSNVSHSIEMSISENCNVFSTMYGGNKMIAENSRETEKKLVHTSPQGRSWTSDSITYTTPSNVTHTTPAGSRDKHCIQEKLYVNRADMTYEYAYREKPKINVVVEGPCEDIPHENGMNNMRGMGSEVQEQMENTYSKASKKVVPGDRTTVEGEPPTLKNEGSGEAGNSSTEEVFVEHQDRSTSNGNMSQGFGDGALLNSDSLNLVPGDCSELEYTPSPGIYTLILNTDNTFSLVSEGCQVPATQTCNTVFVCWPCQKFAPSQAEILSHISANHPQDLSNINHCMFELNPLSSPHGNNTAETVRHVSGRKVQRKLGRPRKEELIGQQEPQPIRRKFKVEANGTLCLDCDKLFPKQRQFNKHRCIVWQDDQVLQDHLLSKHPLTSAAGEAGEISNVDALQKDEAEEEEWQRSGTCKPRGRVAEKRKRGRPPKVDQLRGEIVDKEAFATVNLPKGECDEVLLRDRSDMLHQSTLNSTKCSSDTTRSVGPSRFQHIPTLPLFSNPQQKEHLHKWIAQTDLSFVDDIIDKVYPEKKLSEKRDAPAMFTCRECKLLFRSLTSCRRHCAKHMTKKAFTCPDCDFATANIGGLYSHYRNHTQNLYACDKCDFRARIKAHYRDHLETHNPCRHICRICKKPYSTSSSLRSHIYLNHRNEEGMKYVWWLRRKNQEQDKKNVVFQCPVCYQLFSELSLANQHFVTHEHSTPQEVMRCEVCGLEPLSQEMLKKHLMKHKVVYICCSCGKPQVTASCLHSHLREGACGSYSRDDNLKLSLLYSYTTAGTLPSLTSSKVLGIGPLLQDMETHISHQHLPDTKVCNKLKQQMEAVGYRQISELLQDKLAHMTASTCKSETKVMKIVISTRSSTAIE